MTANVIRVVGARVHNLKNITVEIPRDKLVVITGLSGSGKSSLAFDTIFAEGQRRYVESLSAYARQFLGQMAKPDVDAALPESSRLHILSPLVRGRKGTHQAVLDEIRKTGFVRARVDGVVHELDEEIQMDRYKIHNIEAVVDRVLFHHDPDPEENNPTLTRLTDSIETSLKFGDGYLIVQDVTEAKSPHDLYFSEHLACPEHGSVLPEIEPRTFSFNTPHGACPDCQGLGGKLEIDAELLIPDRDVSLNEGAIIASEWRGPREEGGYYWQAMEAVAKHYRNDLAAPLRSIPQEKLDLILYGTG